MSYCFYVCLFSNSLAGWRSGSNRELKQAVTTHILLVSVQLIGWCDSVTATLSECVQLLLEITGETKSKTPPRFPAWAGDCPRCGVPNAIVAVK